MLDFLSCLMYYIQALNTHYDSLAQLAEHLTFNQGVRGSNPRWITKNRQVSNGTCRFLFLKKAA